MPVAVHDCSLHAYVLMTNHVHLLTTPSAPDGIPRVMRDVGWDIVRAINQSYHCTGTLWEGRFKSSLVDTDRYCLTDYCCIESTPLRAGHDPPTPPNTAGQFFTAIHWAGQICRSRQMTTGSCWLRMTIPVCLQRILY